MRSLYACLDEADRTDNRSLSDAFFEWLAERSEQDDVVDYVGDTDAIRAVIEAVQRP